MNVMMLVIMGLVVLLLGVVLFLFIMASSVGRGNTERGRLSRIVEAQRKMAVAQTAGKKKGVFEAEGGGEEEKKVRISAGSAGLTLTKKLRYAGWRIPPLAYYLITILLSFTIVFFVSMKFSVVFTCVSIFWGPAIMGGLLGRSIERRFKKFDRDYPAYLSTVVSLLKTGMDTTTALEQAAKGLNEDSSVRDEVTLMIERLRFGVPEDKSIGSFGEDINHAEIELFVQALLLSRRVGGNLSETLNRLQKAVRKRQYFRGQAKAAVGMQRGSILVIVFIMIGMEFYLYLNYPEVVIESLEDPVGWMVWQFSALMVMLGMFWVRQVTKIKI